MPCLPQSVKHQLFARRHVQGGISLSGHLVNGIGAVAHFPGFPRAGDPLGRVLLLELFLEVPKLQEDETSLKMVRWSVASFLSRDCISAATDRYIGI